LDQINSSSKIRS